MKHAHVKDSVEYILDNLHNLNEADIADILARLEKKRIRQGGNPDESPLGKKTGRAMKAKQDEGRKKAGVSEGVVSKELKDLSKAGKTLKGKDVAKADKVDMPTSKGYKFGVKEAKDWIQGAVKRPGAFTRKAKAAGMSVQQFAKHVDKNKDKYSTRTERQANLAQTFASMKKEDVEEMIYHMIVEEDRLKKFEAWIQFDEGYQRNPEADTRSARQRRMDDPDKGINSPAFRKFMADREKASSAKKVKKSAPTKSKPNPEGTLHLSPEERKKREAKRREDLYKRSADMRRDHKKRGIGVYAKGAKNPGADMDKKLGI